MILKAAVLVVLILICIVVAVVASLREENRMPQGQCDNCNHFRKTLPTLLPHPTRAHVTIDANLCAECRKRILKKETEK